MAKTFEKMSFIHKIIINSVTYIWEEAIRKNVPCSKVSQNPENSNY